MVEDLSAGRDFVAAAGRRPKGLLYPMDFASSAGGSTFICRLCRGTQIQSANGTGALCVQGDGRLEDRSAQ